MANEYKAVKKAVKKFIEDNLGLPAAQVFRAPPNVTSLTAYPVVVVQSATAQKGVLGEVGDVTLNVFNLTLGILTKAPTALEASDELDDLLKALDDAIADEGAAGLDDSELSDSKWHIFTRLEQETRFDVFVEEQVGMVDYAVLAGVMVVEKTAQTKG